jgi:hypothetical protein
MKNATLKLSFTIFFISFFTVSFPQQRIKPSLRDSLDGAFDLSDYIIHANGFVPVPIIITEPAFGGFGGGLVPVFIKKQPPYIDSINGEIKITPVAPDITGGMAFYTLNNSWMVGSFKSGTLVKARIKYIIGGAYADINMSYYRAVPDLGEKEFKFNIKSPAIFVQSIKRIGYSNWYAGVKYLFLRTDVKYVGDSIRLPPDWVKQNEYSGVVSQLGAVIELDNRDNVFTPDRGMKVHVDGIRSDDAIGSDYDYWRVNYYMYAYTPFSQKLTGGLRIDGQQTFQNPPFFMYPYIDMRGIPSNRYSGKADILTEGEFRWDFYKRWSIMFYGGVGKAFDEWSDFGSADLAYSYGTGFRYLIARKFKLRMGIDIAHGPEEFAYYIVFGSKWLK